MSDELSLFDATPKARASDPDTSHEAAPDPGTRRGQERMTAGQEIVLAALRDTGPVTDEALVECLAGRLSPSGVRTRRAELERLGRVVRVGESVTASGRRAIVWGATPVPPSRHPEVLQAFSHAERRTGHGYGREP